MDPVGEVREGFLEEVVVGQRLKEEQKLTR